MKKSTWFYMLSVLCIVGGLLITYFLKIRISGLLGTLLIFTGMLVGKLGTRHQNIEHSKEAA